MQITAESLSGENQKLQSKKIEAREKYRKAFNKRKANPALLKRAKEEKRKVDKMVKVERCL